MRTVSIRRQDHAFDLTLGTQERALLREVLELLAARKATDDQLALQVGCSRDRLRQLHDRLGAQHALTLSAADLHALHAALSVAPHQFVDEESFHIRVGFYREQALQVAQALVRALNVGA